ncbi:MAG: TIGR04211 family SH3 domain-containing protein [Endozoicomonas sp.]
MKRILHVLTMACSLLLFAGGEVQAETRYVTDVVYVPVRSGPGNQYRITHRGIRTGTEMKVLEADAGDGYSKVVTSNGLDGFIQTHYLVSERPARDRLPEELARVKTLQEQERQLQSTLAERNRELAVAKASLGDVNGQLQNKTSELVALREATADPQALDRRNKQLIEENLQTKNRVQVLEAENNQLMRDSSLRWYLYGGGTIMVGILLGLFLPMIRLKKKPSTDWV